MIIEFLPAPTLNNTENERHNKNTTAVTRPNQRPDDRLGIAKISRRQRHKNLAKLGEQYANRPRQTP